MTVNLQSESNRARAFPVSDAQGHRPPPVINEQGLLGNNGRTRLKKLAQGKGGGERMEKVVPLRAGTLNVGTMTGKGREIADMMERRKVNVLCVQETRWRGDKARELGDGYKLLYSGANKENRNGVDIVLSNKLRDSIVSIKRTNDRIMVIKLCFQGKMINIFTAYAPQVGCDEEEKNSFWEDMNRELSEIPVEERVIIGGDLNGHVGRNKEGIERIHGGWGIGERNAEGERVIDCAVSFDLAVVNTWFRKDHSKYITYKSGGNESQIDFLMCRRSHLKEVKNCKIINGEGVATQHRLVVMDLEIKGIEKSKPTHADPKIKWWRLTKEADKRQEFKEKVLREARLPEGVKQWWDHNSEVIKRIGAEVLGMTSGKTPPCDKEGWWWNDEVQKVIKTKKEAKRDWEKHGQQEDKERSQRCKKEAKKAVAQAKAQALSEIYEELETPAGERKIHKIARSRNKATKDFTHIKQVKDENGSVLCSQEKIKRRWEKYYEKLLNEENPRVIFEDGIQHLGVTQNISRREVKKQLKKMKNGKAIGPDGIPVEAWKSLEEEGIDMLWDLMNKIYQQEVMPEQWRESFIVPIYKEKGDIQDCSNYRGIKLMSHSMKLWERIMDERIREETSVGEEQFGFMPGRGTMDAVFALRQVMEKYREKQKGLHMVFIDLEKAYDRVPRQEVWRCMREKGTPEKYVRLVQDMYEGAKTKVKSSVGLTGSIPVRVGLHQGSALSPYLFDLVMDVISQEVRDQSPWCMMFADDIVICSTDREIVEEKLEQWRKALEDRGLKISRGKTEYLRFNEDQDTEICMEGERLNRVENFKYLGSKVSSNGNMDAEITHRVQAGWRNWRKMSGVLCDHKINVKLKGKVYKTVVRPAMMYGAEAWPLKKIQERKLEVEEMKMLRWMCGVTKMDKIRNERIRGTVKVEKISKKIQERRLQWYGHVRRREDGYVGRRVMEMEVPGRRRRGRPKQRWMDNIGEDMKDKNLSDNDVYDRAGWRRAVRNIDPT